MSQNTSLARHLDTLYLLACVLDGPEAADELVRRVYQRASETRPADWPSEPTGWLLRHLVALEDEDLTFVDRPPSSAPRPSRPSDPLREAVADEVVDHHLSSAFAACSRSIRLVLALDALGISDETLAQGLSRPPKDAVSIREAAHRHLQAALRGALTDSEQVVVEAAGAAEVSPETLRALLDNRYPAPPPGLRSGIRALLRNARRERTTSDEESTEPLDESRLSVFRNVFSSRHLGRAAALLLLAAGATYGLLQLQSPTGSSSLLDQSVAAAGTVEARFATQSLDSARTYVRTTWERRVDPPVVQGTSLNGVGPFRIRDETTAPVFVYADDQADGRILIYAYNYALLDRLNSDSLLPGRLRTALVDEARFVSEEAREVPVLAWRHRDDIFVAVAPHLAPDTLRARIVP